MDFDNMSREGLLSVLRRHYQRLEKQIPEDKYILKVRLEIGKYYTIEQVGDDLICADGHVYLTFNEAYQYFK